MNKITMYLILAVACILLLLTIICIEVLVLDIRLEHFTYMINAAIVLTILAKLKKELSNRIKKSPKKNNKHLNTILKNGFAQCGRTTMDILYSIATGNEDEAVKWMNDNKSQRDTLNKKLLYYELSSSEKSIIQQEYDMLNTQSDVVYYIRYYRREGCDIQEVYERIKNEAI